MAKMPARYCSDCGRELSSEDRFCTNCGGPVHQTATVPTPEADVPVPPPLQAGDDDAAAAQATPQESVRRGLSNPYNLGYLGIVGFLLFAVVVAAIIGGVRNNGGSAGNGGGGNGGEVAEKPKHEHVDPKLVISSPSESPTVTKDSVEVRGKATPANSKVAENGQDIDTDGDGSFSMPFHRNVGENNIQITAEKGSQQVEASRTVTRKLSETPAEKSEAEKQAARQTDEKQQAKKTDDPQQASFPNPPTDDLWFSIPALGLWDQYVTNTSDFSAMDHGAIKLPNSGFPWQKGANTYIAAHRLGWPGTGSYHQFYNLPALKIGDIIYLGDVNGTTYTYRVSDFKEISPNQAREVTGPQPGRDMVSLQTCIENYGHYWTMGPHWYVRFIVQADRVSVTPAK